MSWLNKSLSQLTDVTSSISKFTEDVLAAEPPTGEDDGDQLAEYRRQLGTGLFYRTCPHPVLNSLIQTDFKHMLIFPYSKMLLQLQENMF